MRKHSIFRLAGCGFSAAVSLGLYAPTAQAGFLTKSLQICDVGSFFVGGVPKTTKFATSTAGVTNNVQITVGQMYVQFMIPEARRSGPSSWCMAPRIREPV